VGAGLSTSSNLAPASFPAKLRSTTIFHAFAQQNRMSSPKACINPHNIHAINYLLAKERCSVGYAQSGIGIIVTDKKKASAYAGASFFNI
jgi:hypothetical protein